MSRHSFISHERGFGLLEVMIAVLVLAVGLLSLGSLHSMIIKSSSSAKAKSTAAVLAQEKLDDLTSFQQLPTGGNGTFGFSEIATDTGGNENADGTLVLPTGNITVANVNYNRTWSVQDYYFCTENSAPSTTNTCSAVYPNFKLIAMNVTWTDSDGTSRQVSLQSVVAAISPASSGQSAATGGRGSPTVNYTAGSAPDVIPINVDDNTKKEATKPLPDVAQHGNSTITTFDEITYNTQTHTKRRDNFFTVNCICSQNGTPTSAANEGYAPTTFDGTEYVIPATTTISGVTKRTTTKRTGSRVGNNVADQKNFCDICCRDHHDSAAPVSSNPSSFDSVYDPFRPLADYHSSGDHKHYYVSGNNLVPADDVGATYLEACRMALVGGSPWVLQDWRLETHQITPASKLSTTTQVDAYKTYVTNYITQFLSDSALSSTSSTYPLSTPTPSVTSPLTTAESMTATETSQYVGRGLYIDYMSPVLRKTIRCKINTTLESDCPNSAPENFLHLVPFHEVNLTKIASWTPTDNTNTYINVTSEALADNNAYSRGFVTAKATTPSAQNVIASINRSNSGLTGSHIIDNDDTAAISDSVAITVSSSSSSSGSTSSTGSSSSSSSGSTSSSGTGTVTATVGLYDNTASIAGNDYKLTFSNGASCSQTSSGNTVPKIFTCTLSGGAGTLTITGYSKSYKNASQPGFNNCIAASTTSTGTITVNTPTSSGDTETTAFSLSGFTTTPISVNFTAKTDANSNSGACP